MAGWYVPSTLLGSAYAGEARYRSVRPERETPVQSVGDVREVVVGQEKSD
jgi:hypothetical protein